jgi:hypothetical protein
MNRPTDDKELDASGQYPYGDHFTGRKRLWECRVQIRFKTTPTDSIRFGVELDHYVPLNGAAKGMMGVTVAALKRVAGSDLYHSPGDDPQLVQGPLEKPVFVMPLWAFDQVIVTPEGAAAPDLTSASFHTLGLQRAKDRKAFVKELSAMRLLAGPTYTFAFWGISQFLDNLNWQLKNVVPFTTVDYNQFCGKPPVHIVLYGLKEDDDLNEKRHLQSRKNYYFRLAFWSSKQKPPANRLAELMPDGLDSKEAPTQQRGEAIDDGCAKTTSKGRVSKDRRTKLPRLMDKLVKIVRSGGNLSSISCVKGREKILSGCHERSGRPHSCR